MTLTALSGAPLEVRGAGGSLVAALLLLFANFNYKYKIVIILILILIVIISMLLDAIAYNCRIFFNEFLCSRYFYR